MALKQIKSSFWGLRFSLRWLDLTCHRVHVGIGSRCNVRHYNVMVLKTESLTTTLMSLQRILPDNQPLFVISQRNQLDHQYLHPVQPNRLAARRLNPASGVDGATASAAEAVIRLLAAVDLGAVWKEAASASRAAGKRLAQPDRFYASAAAGASHPSTPRPSALPRSWEAAAPSTASTKDPPEAVIPYFINSLCFLDYSWLTTYLSRSNKIKVNNLFTSIYLCIFLNLLIIKFKQCLESFWEN